MKKNKRYLNSAFALLLSGLAFVSCNDNEVDYVYNQKPSITTDFTAYTVTEGDDLSIVLTASRPSNVPMGIKLEVLDGGTAVLGEDFELPGDEVGPGDGLGSDGYLISFPANTATYTVKIPIILDEDYEQDEHFSLRLSGSHNMNGTIDQIVNVTIKNAPSDKLDMVLSWDKSFSFGGSTISLCQADYDVDILVFDINDLSQEFSDGAQTGDCPEHLVMPLSEYPNGTYAIIGYLYEDQGLPFAGLPTFDIPITMTYSRGGTPSFHGTYTQTTGTLTSDSEGDTTAGPGNGDMTLIAYVNVNNGVFTILDSNNATIAQGRSAVMNQVSSAIKNGKVALKKGKTSLKAGKTISKIKK